MESFTSIFKRAADRKGGEQALEKLLPEPKSKQALKRVGDDRFLSTMTRAIFQAGFSWRVVEQKWDDFEHVFAGFQPQEMVKLTHGDVNELVQDKRIIRNRVKIETIPVNARFIIDTAKEHGSFAGFVASWPEDDLIGLWAHLKKNAKRLGGMSGPYFLRSMGKDTFMLTRDVVTHLVEDGIVDKMPTSKRDLNKVQDVFNEWHQQSKRPYCQISKIIACSIGSPAIDYDA